MKKRRLVALLISLVLLITSISVVALVNTKAADYEVTYVSGDISMSGYNVHSFKVNGYNAYCVEFNDGSPVQGDTFANVSVVDSVDSDLYKTLYYGYGGPGYNTFKSSVPGGVSDNWGIVQTTVLASHYYCGDPASVSGFELYQYINNPNTPAPPSRTVSFSPASVTAVTNNGEQKTPTITLNADNRITLTLALDSDVTLYFAGDTSPHTGNVDVRGGQRFYLAAPTTKNGTSSMSATGGGDQLFTVNVMRITTAGKSDDNVQKLAVAIPAPVTASLQATFTAYGGIALYKSSSNPNISNGSDCYSLSGAVYGVYGTQTDATNMTNAVTTITTDATGYGAATNLQVGTYYVRETTAPKGYALDSTIYPVTVGADVNTRVDVTDTPQMDPVSILLSKQGDNGTLLAGAEFEICFYAGIQQDTDPALDGKSWDKKWIMKTDDNGVIKLDDAHKVSGSDFYYMSNGDIGLPLGTVTIKETKAPVGYKIDDTVYVRQITSSGSAEAVTTYNAPTITNVAKTGILRIDKKGEKRIYNETTQQFETTKAALGGIRFGIYKNDTLVETITTDANGKATSGELALGTYVIKELNTPDEYIKANDLTVTFSDNDTMVDVNGRDIIVKEYEVLNKVRIPDIETTAADFVTGDHVGTVGEKVKVVDTVHGTNLIVNKDYKISGLLMNKSTGLPLVIDGKQIVAEKTFTATDSEMDVELIFELDSTSLKGKSVVCFEYMYRDDILVAMHADITDEDQTVHYPNVKTTAKDSVTLGNNGTIGKTTTIIDTVNLENLNAGLTYTVTGTAYDPETGKAFMVDGKALESSVTFTATESNCSVDVKFTFDTSLLYGKELVFFESLSHNGKEIAVHADLTDKGQTITFPPVPELHTTATDYDNNSHTGSIGETVKIKDVVKGTGLIKGIEYKISGIVYDKSTGEPLVIDGKQIVAEKTFTATDSEMDVELTFELDSTKLRGKTVVCFEYMYQDDVLIAMHADIDDEGQSVKYPPDTPPTGDTTPVALLLLLGLCSIAGLVFFLKKQK